MIVTDKYEGVKGSLVHIIPHEVWVTLTPAAQALIADAPLLLEEVKRLRDELDKQMGFIEWLEEFAPKAGEYNTSWEAYELAKEIDTDKYEGHSTEYSYEILSVDDGKEMYATYALLNDAPLLLAEVKRLRETIKVAITDLEQTNLHEETREDLLELLKEVIE